MWSERSDFNASSIDIGCIHILDHRNLSAPCGSVENVRLFNSVLHIVDDNRMRLMADNAEKLLFIKKNLPLTFPKKVFISVVLLLMRSTEIP